MTPRRGFTSTQGAGRFAQFMRLSTSTCSMNPEPIVRLSLESDLPEDAANDEEAGFRGVGRGSVEVMVGAAIGVEAGGGNRWC